MERNRKRKILTIIALFTAIISISIGFAAFSTTLNISSSTTVSLNSDTFSVKFSTEKDRLVVEEVVASNKTPGLVTTNGVINNNASPIISNLSATFTEPGQFAEYTFYARNAGAYTAYLNSINFIGTKTCTADGDVTLSLVNSACDSISMAVTIGENTYTETTEVSNHSLEKKEGEQILVKISYAEDGARADGPFSVDFGNITMIYSTIDVSGEEPSTPPTTDEPEQEKITWSKTTDGKIVSSVGEVVEIGVTTYTTAQVLEKLGVEAQAGKYNGNWVVLGLDGTSLKLVSEENVSGTLSLGYNNTPPQNEIEEIYDASNLNLEKAIWSWNNVVGTLNQMAQEKTGITSARSLTIEDLEASDVLNISDQTKKASMSSYGLTYRYFLENGKIYSQNIATDNENIDDSQENWSEKTGGSGSVFVNKDKTIINSSNAQKVVKLKSNYYKYTFTSEQKTKFANSLAKGNYWLASTSVRCGSATAYFHVRSVWDGVIAHSDIFKSTGENFASDPLGIHVVVSI